MRTLSKKGAIVVMTGTTVLSVVMAVFLGKSALIVSGAIGIFSSLGVQSNDLHRIAHKNQQTINPIDDPALANTQHPNDFDEKSRAWTIACIGYSVVIIVIGVIFYGQTY